MNFRLRYLRGTGVWPVVICIGFKYLQRILFAKCSATISPPSFLMRYTTFTELDCSELYIFQLVFIKTSQSLSKNFYVLLLIKANTRKYCSQPETVANRNKCSNLEIKRG